MKRQKHSLSHYVLSTFDMGQLIPVGHCEVLPGDSIRLATSCLLRVSPLAAPVMHPVVVRLHHWFVPYRILHEGWEDFITGGTDGLGNGTSLPLIGFGPAADNPSPASGDLADYLGIPVGFVGSVVAFPFIAYNKIYNEFYRDQDLITDDGTGDAAPAIGGTVLTLSQAEPRQIAWEKDYFTAARPWTQKGPEITIPMGGSANVVAGGSGVPTFVHGTTSGDTLGVGAADNVVNFQGAISADTAVSWDDPALMADLSTATAAPVNDLRLAFALQRYQEARAAYGSRYSEYLRYLGVRSSDARLQRPEYLGGGRSTISFSEVLRTGNVDADASNVGDMSGHGISAMRTRRVIRFFEEHGVVMTLASVRPRSMYTDGVHRGWLRATKEDYWQKELEAIGQQTIYNREVKHDHLDAFEPFGYNDRYSEYRHHPSYVTGDFRSTLNDWHLARAFATDPALNQSFIECVPSKRIHAVQTDDVLWGMFSHSIQARRMVSRNIIGRIF